MKFSKKFFLILSMVTILASLFVTTAFAANTRIVRYADVAQIKVLDNQPATFRLIGGYTCDKLQFSSSVTGKTISIFAYDVKNKGTGQKCEATSKFRKEISVGTLVPGIYTIVVNPDAKGKGQKVIKGFIAPLIPTPVPTTTAPVK